MKYRTTVQIISSANDKDEAMEIAGDYLSGNIISGVEMKCSTRPVRSHARLALFISIAIIVVAAGLFSAHNSMHSRNVLPVVAGMDAIQPPLNTGFNEKNADFKKAWQEKHTKEVLDYIKK